MVSTDVFSSLSPSALEEWNIPVDAVKKEDEVDREQVNSRKKKTKRKGEVEASHFAGRPVLQPRETSKTTAITLTKLTTTNNSPLFL